MSTIVYDGSIIKSRGNMRNKEEVLKEMLSQIDYPLNEEWSELCDELFEEWLDKEGASVYSVKKFAESFNLRVAEAEASFLSMSKGD